MFTGKCKIFQSTNNTQTLYIHKYNLSPFYFDGMFRLYFGCSEKMLGIFPLSIGLVMGGKQTLFKKQKKKKQLKKMKQYFTKNRCYRIDCLCGQFDKLQSNIIRQCAKECTDLI